MSINLEDLPSLLGLMNHLEVTLWMGFMFMYLFQPDLETAKSKAMVLFCMTVPLS